MVDKEFGFIIKIDAKNNIKIVPLMESIEQFPSITLMLLREGAIELINEIEKSKQFKDINITMGLEKFVLKNFGLIDDEVIVRDLCNEILSADNKYIEKYKKEPEKTMNILLGIIMRITYGRADYAKTIQILTEVLKKW